MKKKVLFLLSCIIILIISLGVWYSNTFIHFADKNMARRLAYEVGKGNAFFVTQKDLDKITKLSIGPTCYYDTIVDIAYCHNLELLCLNNYNLMFDNWEGNMIFGNSYRTNEIIAEEDSEPDKVERLQEDLKHIFQSCPNITWFAVREMGEQYKDKVGYNPDCLMYTQFTDISFLEYGKNLETVFLVRQNNIEDYSVFLKLEKIRWIDIGDNANFKNIDELPVDRLEKYYIGNTPVYEEMMKEENQ